MIKGLHHNAYRCRDSEETRRFYEDFLGLPLCNVLEIKETKSGRKTGTLHTFYQMDDGSCLAFFEAPDMPFEFKSQHDFDLHIALEVPRNVLETMMAKGKAAGIETRGISDHQFIDSIYFRDPNGYVIELTAKRPDHDEAMDPRRTMPAASSTPGRSASGRRRRASGCGAAPRPGNGTVNRPDSRSGNRRAGRGAGNRRRAARRPVRPV